MSHIRSNDDIFRAWSSWAKTLEGGISSTEEGLRIGWMNRNWAICNQIFLDNEVKNTADLMARISYARAFAKKKDKPWVFNICWQLLSSLNPSAVEEILKEQNLVLVGEFTGMEARQLKAPLKSLPDLDYRRVKETSDGSLYGEINATAYDIPMELGIESLNAKSMWTEGLTTGVVGFHSGVAATCASTVRINSNDAYFAIVATRPEFQRKGLAEAAMRKSLEVAFDGRECERLVLHATPAGRPLYEKMGFERVADFRIFIPSEFMH